MINADDGDDDDDDVFTPFWCLIDFAYKILVHYIFSVDKETNVEWLRNHCIWLYRFYGLSKCKLGVLTLIYIQWSSAFELLK
jgi:hypothetical protein